MDARPLVRARHMKSILEAVEKLPPQEAERVRALVTPEIVQAVRDATSVDWLPVETNLTVTRSIHQALGEAAFYRFFRDMLRDSFSGPLLRIIVEAAFRVFRVDAASFAGWVGRGWGQVFRSCGSWVVDRVGDGEARLRIESLPDVCLRDDVWLRSVAYSLDAFWLFARTSGECALLAKDPERGTATYRLAWK
jgi:hypothetical protein